MALVFAQFRGMLPVLALIAAIIGPMLSFSSMVSIPTVRLIFRGRGGLRATITFWNAKRPGRRFAITSSTGRTRPW